MANVDGSAVADVPVQAGRDSVEPNSGNQPPTTDWFPPQSVPRGALVFVLTLLQGDYHCRDPMNPNWGLRALHTSLLRNHDELACLDALAVGPSLQRIWKTNAPQLVPILPLQVVAEVKTCELDKSRVGFHVLYPDHSSGVASFSSTSRAVHEEKARASKR